MARAIARSLLIGIAAALVCFALGLVAEILVASRVRHPAETPAVATAPEPHPGDDFTVTTSEVLVSEYSSQDPYLIPSSIGVLIVVSAWTYRRVRKAPNT